MEKWRQSWREVFLPQFSNGDLARMLHAMETNDERLMQGRTTWPSTSHAVGGIPLRIEKACAISFIGWQKKQETVYVNDARDFFSLTIGTAKLLASSKNNSTQQWGDFISFWDGLPREEVFKLMIEEVWQNLLDRQPVETSNESVSEVIEIQELVTV